MLKSNNLLVPRYEKSVKKVFKELASKFFEEETLDKLFDYTYNSIISAASKCGDGTNVEFYAKGEYLATITFGLSRIHIAKLKRTRNAKHKIMLDGGENLDKFYSEFKSTMLEKFHAAPTDKDNCILVTKLVLQSITEDEENRTEKKIKQGV